MYARQPLVAGNWKLNGSRSSVLALAEAVSKGVAGLPVEVLVCPSFVHLGDVLGVVGNTALHLGAQDCSEHASGAYTGDCAAVMLAEFGCEYVIVGHSERRHVFGDTNATVRAKFDAVRNAEMTPIVCVGETIEEREAGKVQEIIEQQLDAILAKTPMLEDGAKGGAQDRELDFTRLSNAVVAYEPVWAIGTGKTASPAQAQEVHQLIREKVLSLDKDTGSQLRILYGGSVSSANAKELFSMADIDGGLIGGASLKPDDFIAICQSA